MKAFIIAAFLTVWVGIPFSMYIKRKILVKQTIICGCGQPKPIRYTTTSNGLGEYFKTRHTSTYNCSCGISTAIYTQRGQYRNTREVGK